MEKIEVRKLGSYEDREKMEVRKLGSYEDWMMGKQGRDIKQDFL